jgi:predicted molibdopterin-dependent oxidoreductase YjgC
VVKPEDLLPGTTDIAVLFLCGDDLLSIAPRPDLVERALSSAASVVVIDRFSSNALAFADVVLPSCGFAETMGQ